MLNSSFRYKRLAGGHIRFWRRYSVGSASGGISSHDGSKNDTDSDYITEPLDHISNFSILQPKKVCNYTLFKR